MDLIVSSDNQLYKRINKLKDKKYRDEYKEYLIEGLRGIIDTPREDVKVIVASENFDTTKLNSEKVVVFSEKLFSKLSLTDHSCGVMAIAAQKAERDFETDYVVYLDRIRDPGNMGTIIRTAVASGYEIVCDNCVDVYNPKVVRSCVSALSKARLHYGNFIDKLVDKGYNIIGADLGGGNAFKALKPKKVCIVIGNEADGVRSEILGRCNNVYSIPMENMESLNASVCAGILMYYFKF